MIDKKFNGARQKSAFAQLSAEQQRQLDDPTQLVAVLQRLAERTSLQLETATSQDFAKEWLVNALTTEFLKYCIEDDYVDLAPIQTRAAKALKELLSDSFTLNPAIERFAGVMQNIATRSLLKDQKVAVRLGSGRDGCDIVGSVPRKFCRPFLVSSLYYPFVSLLEQSIANPQYVEAVLNAFEVRLKYCEAENGVAALCFVEKAVGPVGALGMISSLVSKVQLPAFVYRASYWSTRSKLVGCVPKPKTKIALVYDLFVTGDGIRQTSKDLYERFDLQVVAAVVLYSYGKSDRITVDGREIKIMAIGSHDALSDQIERVVSRQTETENIKLLPEHGILADSRFGGRGMGSAFLADNKTKPMQDEHPAPQWRQRLGYYKQKTALKFLAEAELDKALDLFWKDDELYGLPRDYADGRTIVVPTEAVALLRRKGLQFQEINVVSSGDLSPERERQLRKVHGMR